MLLLFLPLVASLYTFLDPLYNEYVRLFQENLSCSSCLYDLNINYTASAFLPTPLSPFQHIIQHPHKCGFGCPTLANDVPMVHYSSPPTNRDGADLCWSTRRPSLFFSTSPTPMYISIRHRASTVFYPSAPILHSFNPDLFEYSRGVEFGKATFFVFFDISESTPSFPLLKQLLLDFTNTLSFSQDLRVFAFNSQVRELHTNFLLTHSSLTAIQTDLCFLIRYGGTKPAAPFDHVMSYFDSASKPHPFHLILVTDMQIYANERALESTVKDFAFRARRSFDSFHLHALDANQKQTGNSELLRRLACENDGHYVPLRGDDAAVRSTFSRFVRALRHRPNALPVGTTFPYLLIRSAEYGVFYPEGQALSRPHYVDVSTHDQLFPLRHRWTFSAIYPVGGIPTNAVGKGDAQYYPTPSIDRVRKYVLDKAIGATCDAFDIFTVDEQTLINQSVAAFDLDVRQDQPFSFCPGTPYDDMSDKESNYCIPFRGCPLVPGTSDEFQYGVVTRCAGVIPAVLGVVAMALLL